MSKLYGIVLLLLVANYASSTFANTYTYEFGQNDRVAVVLKQLDGTIPLLQPVTNIGLNVPSGTSVAYVRVTVNAISPPKVDYDSDTRQVTINFAWTQISFSSYSIVVKGAF